MDLESPRRHISECAFEDISREDLLKAEESPERNGIPISLTEWKRKRERQLQAFSFLCLLLHKGKKLDHFLPSSASAYH